MSSPLDIFIPILFQPVYNLVILILRVLQAIHAPGALGFSIIILTVVINAIIWPFRTKQIKATKFTQAKMAELKPKIEELKVKHKDDKLAFNQAQAALLKEHGVNPAAGCLPSIIPILVIFPLYRVIFSLFDPKNGIKDINAKLYPGVAHLTKLPSPDFFGLNLSTKPSDFAHVGVLILLVPIVTAGLQYFLSRMMIAKPVKEYPSDSAKEKKEKESQQDQMQAMQNQMVVMMPIMIGVFAFQFPVGLALYWNTLTILGIIQQQRISGWGGASGMIKKEDNASAKSANSKRGLGTKTYKGTKVTVERPK